MHNLLGKHIVIIIEDMPAPLDRRVWQEAMVLKNNGAEVSIICPKMKGYKKGFENINGIEIYRHPIPFEAKHAFGFLLEYSTAIFFEFIFLIRIYLKKKIDVIQGCTPPDLMFLPVLFFKLLKVKYVFDHHDLNPELYFTKFNKKGFFYNLLKAAEKMNYWAADYSIAMNASYKKVAVERGNMDKRKVEIVRSGPDLERLKLTDSNRMHKCGKQYLVGYIGIISEQDNVDLLMEIIRLVLNTRSDVHFAIIGDGLELNNVKALAHELNISNEITFYGMIKDSKLLSEIISTCDLCVNPDRFNEFTNVCTSVSTMEYLAFKKAIVQFDLKEARCSAMEASLYAENDNLKDFANKVCYLLDNKNIRTEMGEIGYKRVVNKLSWQHEKLKYLNFYEKIIFENN